VPLGIECYIVLLFPNDLEYNFEFVDASGIFLPRNLKPILATTDMEIVKGFKGDPRQSVKFFGCNQEASLGHTPFGRAVISEITTQKAVKNSDDFGLWIYKDEDCTQGIAKLQTGLFVPAD
jgi:hypothetical protein